MYESFYNLSGKPFQLSPDYRFFYQSTGHKRALSYLLYGIKQGEGFIVITGDVGTGKTTLVNALSATVSDQNIALAKVVTTQIQEEDLLRVVAAEYGLPYESVNKAVLLKNLEYFFRECANQGRRALLLVDEAQNLPLRSVEELRMLSNFQLNGRSLLQSFLLGQREFRHIMRSREFEQLRQRVIAAYHLRPLDIAEARAYVIHRLKQVRWDNDPRFCEEAFTEIHRFAGGVPRRINVFCDRLMLFASLEEKHEIDMDAVRAVTNDMQQEELGNVADEPYLPPMSDPRQPSPYANAAVTGSNQRIDAIESSIASLGESVQRELALLRQAILGGVSAGRPAPGAEPEDPAWEKPVEPGENPISLVEHGSDDHDDDGDKRSSFRVRGVY